MNELIDICVKRKIHSLQKKNLSSIFVLQEKMVRVMEIFNRYPLLRGMVSYSIIWPTSAFIQQKIAGKPWGNFLIL